MVKNTLKIWKWEPGTLGRVWASVTLMLLSVAPHVALCHGIPTTSSNQFYYFGGWTTFFCFVLFCCKVNFKVDMIHKFDHKGPRNFQQLSWRKQVLCYIIHFIFSHLKIKTNPCPKTVHVSWKMILEVFFFLCLEYAFKGWLKHPFYEFSSSSIYSEETWILNKTQRN